jgi:3-dehydro-L-gulonate 2-dehydrogenase
MRVPYNEMKNEFKRVLIKKGFESETAEISSTIIADNSCDGAIDMVVSALSVGRSTFDFRIDRQDTGISQVFIAINPVAYAGKDYADTYIANMSEYIKTTSKMAGVSDILYPGERVVKEREVNLRDGIPVNPEIWETVLKI